MSYSLYFYLLGLRYKRGVEGGGDECIRSGLPILRVEKFRYLRSIIEEKGDTDDDINYCIRVG